MAIKQTYLRSDTHLEITYKNKVNIIDLYSQLEVLSESSNTSFKRLGELVGDYSQDINGNLDSTKSVIENISIVAENLKSVENRANANEQRITSVESRVSRIENDGIGNYIGTYSSKDNDDSSSLPNSGLDKDRAITEYLVADDYKYQEWEYKVDTWTKIGAELDSHIHSQSSGITLADVATQQDPKIAKKLDKTIYDLYEEKEITITPAVYGWKKITDYWTNPLKGKKYINDKVRVVINANIDTTEIFNMVDYVTDNFVGHLGIQGVPIDFIGLENSTPDKLSGPSGFNIDNVNSYIEIWDIITPAVKATVRVKK